MDQIIKKLRMLKNVSPDADFAFSSRMSVLSSSGMTPSIRLVTPGFWTGFAVMAASVMIVIFLSNVRTPNVAKSISDIASIDADVAIFEEDINITLREIRSYGASAKKTSVALYEASSNGPSHINSSLIKKEFDTLDMNLPDPEEANRLLEQAIF